MYTDHKLNILYIWALIIFVNINKYNKIERI